MRCSVLISICAVSTVLLFQTTSVFSQPSESVKIGKQEWSSRNLEVATFSNGEPIPQIRSVEEWQAAGEAGKPAWCYYGNLSGNGKKYGKLYNWFAATDPRGLCPNGWRLPAHQDWQELVAGLNPKSAPRMMGTHLWMDKKKPENSSGFSGLPGGSRFYTGAFFYLQKGGIWWSSDSADAGHAWSLSLHFEEDEADMRLSNKQNGFSVRCIRN